MERTSEQAPHPHPDVPGRTSEPPPRPDIEFRATVRSDRLRFREDPRTAVRFPGAGRRTSVSRSERTNLPDEVVAGEEYRDASVAYRLATRLTGPAEDIRDGEGGTAAPDPPTRGGSP